jgi:hypothetical protein
MFCVSGRARRLEWHRNTANRRVRPPRDADRCSIHLRSFGIKSLLHFFCSLEEGHGFLWDRDGNSGTRIAGSPRFAGLSRKRAESPQLHSISARQSFNDLVHVSGLIAKYHRPANEWP